MLTEAKAVVTVFEDNNPGLTLIISPVRDLQRQVDLWCKNKTVKQAAARLIQDARAKLAESNFLASPTAASVSDFRSYLKTYLVDPEPSSAAPGTSDHGQQHAVDFVVKEKGGRTLADTETATIRTSWHNTGFDKALKTATENTPAAQDLGTPVLQGPLRKPYEPWHYTLPKGRRKAALPAGPTRRG